MRGAGTTRSTHALRATGWILAAIGLGPLLWAGVRNSEIGVLRLAILDPLLVVAICALAAITAPARVTTALSTGREWLLNPSDRVFAVGLFAWVVGVAFGFSWYCFGGQTIITDELTQAFQARVFLSGHLAAHGEALREFFETSQTVRVGDRWFAQFPLGAPLLSALGEATHLPFVVHPVIAGLAAVGIYTFARRAFGQATGRLSGLLFGLSPFALFMAASRMNHTATLAASVLALVALAKWTDSENEQRRQWAAIGIGVGIGLMTLLRPYDAVLVAVPIGLFQLWMIRDLPRRARSLPAQIAAALLVTGIQLYFNWKTTGRPFEFGYDALNGPEHRPGFHVDPIGRDFTPARGAYWVGLYLLRLNATMLETMIPAMVFIAGALIVARRASRWDWLLVGVIGSTIAGYWAYWFPGLFLGSRFLFIAMSAFAIFAARFVAELWRRDDGVVRRTAVLLLPVSVLIAWLPVATAHRATGVWPRVQANRSLVEPRTPDVGRDVRAAGLTNALVLVREPFHRRLAARLRALGMRPYAVEQVIPNVDACALFEALNAGDTAVARPDSVRLATVLARARDAGHAEAVPGLLGSRSLALVGGRPSSTACADEIAVDNIGTAAFEVFLALSTFDESGRLGGNVVFARDFGAKNNQLRARFGDRAWYYYRSDSSARGIKATFVPY